MSSIIILYFISDTMLRINFILCILISFFLGMACISFESNKPEISSDFVENTPKEEEPLIFNIETSSDFNSDEAYLQIKKEVLKYSNIYRKSQRRSSLSIKSELNKIA
ncbi:MAG: hypothetical protein AAF696_18000, partial [Bacteroidota bacterium]